MKLWRWELWFRGWLESVACAKRFWRSSFQFLSGASLSVCRTLSAPATGISCGNAEVWIGSCFHLQRPLEGWWWGWNRARECGRQGNAAAVSMQNRWEKNQVQLAVTSCLGQKAKSLYPNEFNPFAFHQQWFWEGWTKHGVCSYMHTQIFVLNLAPLDGIQEPVPGFAS